MEPSEYYISTGAKNCFYTLRHRFDETVYFRSPSGTSTESRIVRRDYFVQNLSTDRAEAVARAKEITSLDLSANFEVDPIARREGDVDWSILQGGKHQGKSIHQIREVEPDYLVWLVETYPNSISSKVYGRTAELARALVAHELTKREAERSDRRARAQSAKEILKPLSKLLADDRNGFRDSLARYMEHGSVPRGRARLIATDILAKMAGRSGSKAYEAEWDRVNELMDRAEQILSPEPKSPAANAEIPESEDLPQAEPTPTHQASLSQ